MSPLSFHRGVDYFGRDQVSYSWYKANTFTSQFH